MSGARPFVASDFPGYTEAVQRENAVRGAACLGINEKICGIEVRPLTAAHVRWLVLIKSPFLIRGLMPEEMAEKPDIIDDIFKFLWIVSPMFKAGSVPSSKWKRSLSGWSIFRGLENPRDRFNRVFSPIVKLRIDTVCDDILTYIDEAWIDAGEPDSNDKTYYAFEVEIAQELHQNLGFRADFWNEMPDSQNPLKVPLKIVFQFRKLRAKLNNPDYVLTNRSEIFISKGLEEMNRAEREKN